MVSHGATVNGVYRYGDFPLRAAARVVDPAIVEKLIRCGADVNLKDKGGRLALREALYQKPKTEVLQIVKLLVENGADTKNILMVHHIITGDYPATLTSARLRENIPSTGTSRRKNSCARKHRSRGRRRRFSGGPSFCR